MRQYSAYTNPVLVLPRPAAAEQQPSATNGPSSVTSGSTPSICSTTSPLNACRTRTLAFAIQHPQKHVHTAKENTFVKFLISGSVAFFYELAMGHPFEFVKVVKQTRVGSYPQLIGEITAKKGLIGIWDGFFPWGAIQALAKGSVFGGAHAFARGILVPFADDNMISHMSAEVIAGGFGGGVQGLVLSPTLLLKTRVMTDPIFRQKMTFFQTNVASAKVGMNVIKNEGIGALMKGSITFSMKRVADWATRFWFCVLIEDYLFKKGDPGYKLSSNESLAASLIGGTASAIVTMPMDIMVAQIQQASKAGQKVSFAETFRAQGGFLQTVKFASAGFVPRALHVAFTTAVMKTGTSLVYDLLHGPKS